MPPTQRTGPKIDELFRVLATMRGTALYLAPGQPPQIRLSHGVRPLAHGPLSCEELLAMLRQVMSAEQRLALDGAGETEFVHLILPGGSRVRVYVANHDGQLQASAYRLPL